MENTPNGEAVVLAPPESMHVMRPPETILQEAAAAAAALKNVLDRKKKPLYMNGERYLEYEDWQTLGHFYGVTAKVVMTKPVRYGEHTGFLARAVALRNGQEISAAEAICTTEEDHWRVRPVYGTEEGTRKRVQVGERKVEAYQRRSMAQTRAAAKALRNVLAWVVVMAGYQPTPAEEMPESEFNQERLPYAICGDCGDDLWSKAQIEKTRRELNRTLCPICERHRKTKSAEQALEEKKAQYASDAIGKKVPEHDPNRGVEQFFVGKVAGD